MWNTCDGSPTNTLAKLTSTNLDNKSRQSDQKWSFFDIDNPREYLTGGSDAHLVEKGPYNLRVSEMPPLVSSVFDCFLLLLLPRRI